ncbi:Hypothetical protein KQS_00395 [Flavobacterium indicum GPTSA100-9 = DSM 17447]|uniref:Uncharacterized protein n=1 Tax=Flavobacterium indicum (strain DSM 17447 / CIP 109464 / GPTSA100-9) TaxID=1094466 RepID=H8XNH5_FLAIG|nr:hypothetical protein [Flavobacterium indicum]CCG52092.1 Hypothetical protein KQS_00395 [Flavobacterium indicum GPTSA100-9 = DSM 17447]
MKIYLLIILNVFLNISCSKKNGIVEFYYKPYSVNNFFYYPNNSKFSIWNDETYLKNYTKWNSNKKIQQFYFSIKDTSSLEKTYLDNEFINAVVIKTNGTNDTIYFNEELSCFTRTQKNNLDYEVYVIDSINKPLPRYLLKFYKNRRIKFKKNN